jgi:heme/copper-type cytochrome/quinol oxidase subunit 4
MQTSHSDKAALMRQGVMVFVGLAALTGVEFWVAVGGFAAPLPLLAVVALGKTALIAVFFMHLGKLFLADEEGS